MRMQAMWSTVRRILFWAVPFGLVAILVWTFLPRGGSVPLVPQAPSHPVENTALPPDDAGPSQEPVDRSPAGPPYAQIQKGDLEGTDEAGHERWRIVADQVTVIENKETVLLRNVRATMYQKGGGTITVTGIRGRFDTKTHEVEVTGNVHGMSTNGRELFADRLRWAPDSGKIIGSGHVELRQARVVMYADQLISDTTLGQTRFFGHVHAAVR
jgi:LPS export ABC transporter protein LptC